jgi:hypothetical protein
MEPMGTFLRRLFWFVIVAALCYAAYAAYVRWWDDGFTERAKEAVTTFVNDAIEKARTTVGVQVEKKANEVVDTVVSEATGAATRYVKEKASDALSAVGAKIVETVGTFIGTSTTDRFPAGTVPVATTTGFQLPPPPATLVTNVGEPLVFSVTHSVSYEIAWGDGTTERGTVPRDVMQLVSHAWEVPGDYAVTLLITDGGTPQTYSFPVRVYGAQ